MPLYGQLQPGSNSDKSKNVVCVNVGDSYTLLDGTEEFTEIDASVAFARGAQGSADGGMTFAAYGGMEGDQIGIEVAPVDEDDKYAEVNSISIDSTGNGAATDLGRSAFYRVRPGLSGSPVTGITVIVTR